MESSEKMKIKCKICGEIFDDAGFPLPLHIEALAHDHANEHERESQKIKLFDKYYTRIEK